MPIDVSLPQVENMKQSQDCLPFPGFLLPHITSDLFLARRLTQMLHDVYPPSLLCPLGHLHPQCLPARFTLFVLMSCTRSRDRCRKILVRRGPENLEEICASGLSCIMIGRVSSQRCYREVSVLVEVQSADLDLIMFYGYDMSFTQVPARAQVMLLQSRYSVCLLKIGTAHL